MLPQEHTRMKRKHDAYSIGSQPSMSVQGKTGMLQKFPLITPSLSETIKQTDFLGVLLKTNNNLANLMAQQNLLEQLQTQQLLQLQNLQGLGTKQTVTSPSSSAKANPSPLEISQLGTNCFPTNPMLRPSSFLQTNYPMVTPISTPIFPGDFNNEPSSVLKTTQESLTTSACKKKQDRDTSGPNQKVSKNMRGGERGISKPKNQNNTSDCKTGKFRRFSSKYRGVYWNKECKAWRARLWNGGKSEHLGNFKTEIEAAHAFDKRAREVGRRELNFPRIQGNEE